MYPSAQCRSVFCMFGSCLKPCGPHVFCGNVLLWAWGSGVESQHDVHVLICGKAGLGCLLLLWCYVDASVAHKCNAFFSKCQWRY